MPAHKRERRSLLSRFRKAFSQPPVWSYDSTPWGTAARADREEIENDFQSYVTQAYKDNGVVFACMLTRMLLFSEARFQWQGMSKGRPGRLFGNPELALLERPWPNGTTGELLARMIQDADLAGNFFATTADDAGNLGRAATGPGRRLVRMRPDWTQIVLGSKSGGAYALDTRPIAYQYAPPPAGGMPSEPTLLLPSEVVHFSPNPDPLAQFRGMSWLTPVIREIKADKAASKHKLKFFEHGATLGTIVTLDKDVDEDAFDEFVERFKAQHEGADTAYKTLVIGGGATPTIVGANMQQLDFKVTQGAGETRIASAAGTHPVAVGLSEGLAGSSLNAGNFDAAIRFTIDKTIRYLWRTAASSLAALVTAPDASSRLWYDDRDVKLLQNNATDAAEIQVKQMSAAKQALDAGYEPDSVTEYLETGDLSVLKHTGRPTVQVQSAPAALPAAPTNPNEGE
jgi:phage portal protein BeeE